MAGIGVSAAPTVHGPTAGCGRGGIAGGFSQGWGQLWGEERPAGRARTGITPSQGRAGGGFTEGCPARQPELSQQTEIKCQSRKTLSKALSPCLEVGVGWALPCVPFGQHGW